MSEKSKKTAPKRIGVKSAFAYGSGKLVVVSFGKGRFAEIVWKDGDPVPSSDAAPEKFGFRVVGVSDDVNFEQSAVKEAPLRAVTRNPAGALADAARKEFMQDYLLLKDQYEGRFFGRTYAGENMRIQIVYQILNLQKTLGVFVNAALFCLNNLQRTGEPVTEEDWKSDSPRGPLYSRRGYEVAEALSDSFPLYGDVFFPFPRRVRGSGPTYRDAIEWNVSVLRILGKLRRITGRWKYDDFWSASSALRLKFNDQLWKIIHWSYANRIRQVNASFFKNSRVNLGILFELLDARTREERDAVVSLYYRFSIRKESKNIGLNLCKLREIVFQRFFPYVSNPEFDSYRPKLRLLADFLFFRYLTGASGAETLELGVTRLRMADEKEKEDVYRDLAVAVMEANREPLERLFFIRPDDFQRFRNAPIEEWDLPGVAIETEDAYPAVELVAFLCNFLDTKEINELVSSFIDKLDAIQSFVDVGRSLGEEMFFTKLYGVFNENGGTAAGEIAEQLRVLLSVGKMKGDTRLNSRCFYEMAVRMFGFSSDQENGLTESAVAALFPPIEGPLSRRVGAFRLFLLNNALKSRRFVYLARYVRPDAVRALMSNRKIVRFVLERLPDDQLDGYVQRALGPVRPGLLRDRKLEALTEAVSSFSFNRVLELGSAVVDNEFRSKNRKDVAVERIKTLMRLYLTVAYVAVKNLVKANLRYYMGYAAFERDSSAIEAKLGANEFHKFCVPYRHSRTGDVVYSDVFALLKGYLARDAQIDAAEAETGEKSAKRRHFPNKRWRGILEKNLAFAEALDPTGRTYQITRNEVSTFAVLRRLDQFVDEFCAEPGEEMKSYFDLYHFIGQRSVLQSEKTRFFAPLDPFRAQVRTFPSHDLIKCLFIPFGYSLPRYKTLTVEALFEAGADGKRDGDSGS